MGRKYAEKIILATGMSLILKITRTIIIAIPIIALTFLFNKNFAVSGHLEVARNFKKLSPFISEFSPLERLGEIEKSGRDYYQVVTGEPIFFRLTMPQIFRTAKVLVTFQSNEPILELGAQLAPLGINYEFKPLLNRILENLTWDKIQEGDLILFQREKKYNTIADFLAQPPARKEVALYNYDLKSDFRISGYTPKKSLTKINLALGGAHSFYTYIKNEPLVLNLKINDLNQHDGPDPLVVVVSHDGSRVYSTTVEDDGNTSDNGVVSAGRDVKISVADLAEGVYKVELLTTDDVVIRQIETRQRYMAFIGHLNLVGGAVKRVYASGHKFDFQTTTEQGFQELKVNNQKLSLAEAFSPISLLVKPYQSGMVSGIYAPQGNVLIESDGLFALSREALFDPTVIDLKNVSGLDDEGINYILARYDPPKKEDGWQVTEADFDLGDKAISNNKLKFSLAAPGMTGGEIKIKKIKVILEKEPMGWGEFWGRVGGRLGIMK